MKTPLSLDREVIVPKGMENIFEQYGYAPAVRLGALVYCAGQVGRDADLRIIEDPAAQFAACWHNLKMVLEASSCTFEDVVDMTTYHVDLPVHFDLFKAGKAAVFPRGLATWTAIGVSALARPGLLLEIKATALIPPGRRR